MFDQSMESYSVLMEMAKVMNSGTRLIPEGLNWV